MKHKWVLRIFFAAAIALGLVILWVYRTSIVNGGRVPGTAQVNNDGPSCSSIDLDVAVKRLSEGWDTSGKITKPLIEASNQSLVCRKAIIGGLMHAMDKPEINFFSDESSYYLWSNGSAILGQLKATEALDLLISHLDLSDGLFSASMVHRPAIHGVEAMGSLAVPKLVVALKENPNRNIRLAAALCLADIAGAQADAALLAALKSEKDECVRRFIELCFEPPTAEVLQQRF